MVERVNKFENDGCTGDDITSLMCQLKYVHCVSKKTSHFVVCSNFNKY